MKQSLIYPKAPPTEPGKPDGKNERATQKELGLWYAHDPAIFKDEKTGYYYTYCTGAVCRRSEDLIHWELVGKVVDEPPKESSDWVGGTDIWAPDIVKVGDEYRLYCSNSTWGVRQSCIFLVVSNHPEGPFEPRGCVLKTTDEMPVNAIDANIITDVKTGDMYMVYGSFWGGCHILKLDPATGLAVENGIGQCVARRPGWMSAAIEGPYIIYNTEMEYYYLFVSYGSLKSDYQVRVGRSKKVTGPYLDYRGRDMTDVTDTENEVGLLLMAGYGWNDGTAYMAPGHNSVLHDSDDNWYIVCHIREKNFTGQGEPSTMQVRKIFWSTDGWPMVSAQPYAGEQEQSIQESDLIGFYERITFANELPQGIRTAVPMKLGPGGYYENCSIQGKWKMERDILKIEYGPHKEEARVSVVWDAQRKCPTIAIAGISNRGINFWAKRIGSLE